MKKLTLLLSLLLTLSFNVNALNISYKECAKEKKDISSNNLIFFNKAELINLGSCVGVASIKRGVSLNLVKSCNEVVEDKMNTLGVLSLSKAEAIQIGQCLGVINYIYAKYHDEYIYDPYGRSSGIYQCKKGMSAVKAITKQEETSMSKLTLRDSLCH